jgi:hypothetical protein
MQMAERNQMSDTRLATKLTRGIRSVATLADDPEREVESYLEKELRHLDAAERLQHLEQVARQLTTAPHPEPVTAGSVEFPAGSAVQGMVARFLGSAVGSEELAPAELADKFGAALDTICESLNQIVSTISVSLLGESPELETIRKVIGWNLQGEAGYATIKEYLEGIQKAFLVAHCSFQRAAETVFGELLSELDPAAQPQGKISGLKFGPLRKAELYDQSLEKHQRCRRWLASGQHRERLLREFERECRLRFDGGGP